MQAELRPRLIWNHNLRTCNMPGLPKSLLLFPFNVLTHSSNDTTHFVKTWSQLTTFWDQSSITEWLIKKVKYVTANCLYCWNYETVLPLLNNVGGSCINFWCSCNNLLPCVKNKDYVPHFEFLTITLSEIFAYSNESSQSFWKSQTGTQRTLNQRNYVACAWYTWYTLFSKLKRYLTERWCLISFYKCMTMLQL